VFGDFDAEAFTMALARPMYDRGILPDNAVAPSIIAARRTGLIIPVAQIEASP